MRRKSLFSALCLVLASALTLLAACAAPASDPSPTPAATPRSGEVVVTAQPGSTSTPSETAAPLETPAATDTAEQPLDVAGSFRSDTGTALNLVADWHCVSVSAQNVKLTITLWLESYSLSVGERMMNTMTVGGETYTFLTDAIEAPGGELSRTQLYIWSKTLPLGADGTLRTDMEAVWQFNGSYSGAELRTIAVSGVIAAP